MLNLITLIAFVLFVRHLTRRKGKAVGSRVGSPPEPATDDDDGIDDRDDDADDVPEEGLATAPATYFLPPPAAVPAPRSPVRDAPSPPKPTPAPPTKASAATSRKTAAPKARYLLDADPPAPRATLRTAAMMQMMSGPGLCTPPPPPKTPLNAPRK